MCKSAHAVPLAEAPAFGGIFAETTLLNVSTDQTGELGKDFNAALNKHWQGKPIPADWQNQFPNGSSPYTSSLGERHAAD